MWLWVAVFMVYETSFIESWQNLNIRMNWDSLRCIDMHWDEAACLECILEQFVVAKPVSIQVSSGAQAGQPHSVRREGSVMVGQDSEMFVIYQLLI